MKRTTVVLPDDLYQLMERERRRRDVSAAAIMREALAAYLNATNEPRHIPFAGLGESGYHDTGRRIREILREEWGHARDS
ncbi:MAG: CopG family transcriptional regulator [Dehalococcoidia bacterium]